ncbi:MGMT family protein [Arcicella rigui]|uniref:MGMT family protein n=1 Tax=Arcicella rigui TaxID=797020 RepID=A0ABU5Q8Y6_9BACT|nr:MGMT family protein [Arcicella rigui]MEA5139306.1 MGMT family protein [Arcicella rigui]
MKNAFEDIYEVVRLIPYGKVSTYGEIAAYLGNKRAARMVGWAMCASHGDSSIPAHRVVNRNGLLSGKAFFGGNLMQELLEQEGIVVENNKIQNFKAHLWIPSKELL